MREALLEIVNKHLRPSQLDRLFKHALPELQEFKQQLLDKNLSDKKLLIATHELCQRAMFRAITPDLENDLSHFLIQRGIKNYFIKDTTENFLKKCLYYQLIEEESLIVRKQINS